MFKQNRAFERKASGLDNYAAELPTHTSKDIIHSASAQKVSDPVAVIGNASRNLQAGRSGMHRLATPQTRHDLSELNCNTFGDPRMACTSPNLGPPQLTNARRKKAGPSSNPLSAVNRRSASVDSGASSRGGRLDNRQRASMVRRKQNKDRSLAEWQPVADAVNQRSFATGTAMKPKGERAFAGTASLAAAGWLQRAGGAKQARNGKFCPLTGGTMSRAQDQRLTTSSIAAIPPEKNGRNGRWAPNEKYHGRVTNFDWLGVERGLHSQAKPSRSRLAAAGETWEHHMFEQAAAQPRDKPSSFTHHGGSGPKPNPTPHFKRIGSDVTRLGTL